MSCGCSALGPDLSLTLLEQEAGTVFADRGRARPADHGHYSDLWADPQHEDTSIAILVRSVRDRVNAEVETQALGQAEVVAATASGRSDLAALVSSSAREVRGRVVIVDRRGVVLADSKPGSVGADYSSRAEIARALRGHIAQEQRDSSTLRQRILATAVPIVRGGAPTARYASPRASTPSGGRCARQPPGSCWSP